MSTAIQPFKVDIPEADVDRLRTQLQSTRHPTTDIVPEAGKDYGLDTQWALDLHNHWMSTYSWSDAQEAINRFDHFTTTIEDITIHFIHQRSLDPAAIPLLLLHGWPGSFHEFSEVIEPLCNPPPGQPSFHCIVPSLPGFCFSSPPPRKGWTVKDTARIFHTLLTDRLGYSSYCVQAGDWGQFIARELGAQYTPACKLVHLNYCPGALPPDLDECDLTAREKSCRDRGIDWRTNHVGYAVLMRTRPQTLAWMCASNPLSLLAFVGEKYDEAANPIVQASPGWKDMILTTVCLYYFTNCIGTSALIYYENVPHHKFAEYAVSPENLIKCPFGYTSFAFDTAPNSKRAVERAGKLVFYRERDYAGHFACLEDPEGVVEDVRALVDKHWS